MDYIKSKQQAKAKSKPAKVQKPVQSLTTQCIKVQKSQLQEQRLVQKKATTNTKVTSNKYRKSTRVQKIRRKVIRKAPSSQNQLCTEKSASSKTI